MLFARRVHEGVRALDSLVVGPYVFLPKANMDLAVLLCTPGSVCLTESTKQSTRPISCCWDYCLKMTLQRSRVTKCRSVCRLDESFSPAFKTNFVRPTSGTDAVQCMCGFTCASLVDVVCF